MHWLRLHRQGGPAALLNFTAEEARIEVRIEPDPCRVPTWLGRFCQAREPGAVRVGPR
jgi:hypothetical protein